MFVFLTDMVLRGHRYSSKTEELIENKTRNLGAWQIIMPREKSHGDKEEKRVEYATIKLICIFYVNGFDSS